VNEASFIDYYDLMQVSPNADEDTIQRVFRHLAKKWHPDRSQGDPERFKLLVDAQRTLTNPATRAAYDIKYQMFWETKWKLAAEASDGRGFAEDRDVRERMLSLYYVQRRSKMHKPGLGEYEVAHLMRIPIELVEFHIWYLREKGWIQRLDNGPLAITALGVDEVEKGRLRLTPDRLLKAVSSDDESDAGRAQAEPDGCFPVHDRDLRRLDEAIRTTDVHQKKAASAEV
jgi:curved DNA-binding protein